MAVVVRNINQQDKLSALSSTTSAELESVISDGTGSGSLVFSTSPSLTTPSLGAATATTINDINLSILGTGFSIGGGTIPRTINVTANGVIDQDLSASNVVSFAGLDLSGTNGSGHVFIPSQSSISPVVAGGISLTSNLFSQAVFATQAFEDCILDFSNILGSSKTFSFPNTSGTLALTSQIPTLPVAATDGGTGITSYTIGDLLYASGATTLSKLADVATGQVLISGGVGTAPSYSDSPTVTTLTGSTSVLTPLLDRSTSGTLTIGGTATTAQLAAGVSLSGAAGAGGLSLGSMTGATTLPTGNGSWTGANGSTLTFAGTNANISITTTTSGTTTIGGGSNLIFTNNGSQRMLIGANVAISSGIDFAASGGSSFNWSSATGSWGMPQGVGGWTGSNASALTFTSTNANITLATTSSGSVILNAATSGDISLRNNNSTRIAAASTYCLFINGAGATPTTFGFRFTGAAHTAMTASTEAIITNFNLAQTVQFATGALTTQRTFLIQAPTYGFVGSSTITNAATLAIDNAPQAGTNATITNAYALWIQAGTSRFDGAISSSGSGAVNFGSGTGDFTFPTGSVTWSGATGKVFSIQGGQKYKRTSTATDYTALPEDCIIGVTSTAAVRTITLPAAATAGAGTIYTVKDESGSASTNNIVIDGNGSETIDGSLTKSINTNYGAVNLYTDGSNWFIW